MEKLRVSGRLPWVVLRTVMMGWESNSDHCADNTAGRCDSVEEDPVLLGDKRRVLLMAIFTYFTLFLFWWTLSSNRKISFPEAGTDVLEAVGEWTVCCIGKWLVWCLCWGGWGDASSGEVFYWGKKWVRHHWEQHAQLQSLGLEAGGTAPAHSTSLVSLTNSVWLKRDLERQIFFNN